MGTGGDNVTAFVTRIVAQSQNTRKGFDVAWIAGIEGTPAPLMKLVDIQDLKSWALWACRFESGRGHHLHEAFDPDLQLKIDQH